jgi:hypothetical protein
VHTCDVRNEENTPGFWLPVPNAAQYAHLLDKTVTALRAAEPTAAVVTGGLAATTGDGGAIADPEFLRQLAALGGFIRVQAVGYYPYLAR